MSGPGEPPFASRTGSATLQKQHLLLWIVGAVPPAPLRFDMELPSMLADQYRLVAL